MSIQVGVGVLCRRAGQLLMVQRGRDPGKGKWALPGGRMDFGETLAVTAQREVLEETGVRCSARAHGIWAFDVPVSPTLQYVVVDVEADYVSGEPRAGDDAAAAAFVDAGRWRALVAAGLVHSATVALVERLRVFQ